MKEGAPYPKSGPYREHKPEIDSHIEKSHQKEAVAERMFQGYELTPEEMEDVTNFAEYASLRLSAGAVSSPLQAEHRYVGSDRSPEKTEVAHRLKDLAMAGHDHWHAALRYKKTGGKSLVPDYMLHKQKYMQYLTREGFIEEITVDVLDPGSHLATNLLEQMKEGARNDELVKTYVEDYFSDRLPGTEMKRLSEESGASFFAKVHILAALGSNWITASGRAGRHHKVVRASFQALFTDVLENPDPEYMRVAARRYNQSVGVADDQRFQMEEFRSMVGPLLQRLRLKKMITKLESQS